jgi:DNA-binding response OmpR family regulator
MFDSTILVVSTDRSFAPMLHKQLTQKKIRGNRIIASTNADEACDLLQTVRVRVAVVSLDPEHIGYDEVDHILWATSILRNRVPVLVVADRYRVDQAITLYRMGVSDYVSRSHHIDQLGAWLTAYLPQLPTGSAVLPQPQEPERVATGKSRAEHSRDLPMPAV